MGSRTASAKPPRSLRGGFLFALASLGGVLPGTATERDASAVQFAEVAAEAGLDFQHVNGMTGERWILETVGAGVGVLDFDGDGLLDIWLVQGGAVPEDASAGATASRAVKDRLFRNVTSDGQLRFHDITDASGVRATHYGMGIATGDIDGDGDADVFLANYGPNQLFENVGGGRFREVRAALSGARWSVSASFADIDGDGRLDLYVANYLDFTLRAHKDCPDLSGRPSYCAPTAYPAVSDRLYRNLGEGHLKDITDDAGIADLRAPGLGVAAHDFDGDGDTDFYVANDGAANHLWLNQGDDTLRDGAELAFAAFNANGAPEAGMGVDAEDYDGDCDPDLFVTHLATETNTLYVNHGGWFSDSTAGAGLAASSGPYTGFGTGWIDADNDGDLDLFSANGAVFPVERQRLAGDPYPLRQRNQLWINDGAGIYRELTSASALDTEEVSRGAAFADLDNDGDTDIVVSNNSGPPRLYRNDAAAAPWIGLELPQGTTATLEGETCPLRRASTDGSYASANDPRLLFRLTRDEPHRVHLRWPDGRKTTTAPLHPNRYHRPNAKH